MDDADCTDRNRALIVVREPRFYSALTIQREPKPSATSVPFVVLSVPAKFVFIRVHSWLGESATWILGTKRKLGAEGAELQGAARQKAKPLGRAASELGNERVSIHFCAAG